MSEGMAVMDDDGHMLLTGRVWHVRLPGDDRVKTMKIIELTLKTVLLEEMPRSFIHRRYEIAKVKFIEEE